ncbi:MAG: flotillin family protein, partial [Clostridia bacterium]|nr:flotillin family protein [Clostridia bacterium]
TVWDGNGNNENGKTATANFISGMAKSLPPMTDIFAMTGLTMPELIRAKEINGAAKDEENKKAPENAKETAKE